MLRGSGRLRGTMLLFLCEVHTPCTPQRPTATNKERVRLNNTRRPYNCGRVLFSLIVHVAALIYDVFHQHGIPVPSGTKLSLRRRGWLWLRWTVQSEPAAEVDAQQAVCVTILQTTTVPDGTRTPHSQVRSPYKKPPPQGTAPKQGPTFSCAPYGPHASQTNFRTRMFGKNTTHFVLPQDPASSYDTYIELDFPAVCLSRI